MNNEKLGKLLQAAEKYGAEAAYEMAVELQAPGVDPQTLTNETAEIAAFINKGTRRIVEGKDGVGNTDGSLTVDPFTNLPI